ncbi:MAG: hypothetical protein JNG83_06920 [Opitutaceae bacterium]|nr:hypothetical protein [Opitutaceae bacterium]
MVLSGLLLAIGAVRAAPPGEDSFHFPSTGVAVGREAVLLSIDEYLLPLRENVSYYLTRPTSRPEPVLRPSAEDPRAPDQAAAHFYGTVLRDGGKFRMWYYSLRLASQDEARGMDAKFEGLHQGPVCYAESEDGITWIKPKLGQVEINGSRENNAILLPDDRCTAVLIIKDDDDPDPNRRYKMVYNPWNGRTFTIRNATSPDGLRWTAAPAYGTDEGEDTALRGIEISSFYKFNGLYVVNGARQTPSEGGHRAGRQGKAFVSKDFNRWFGGVTGAFLLPEPADPAARGSREPYDQVHLGVGGVSLGNVLVGLYGIWHNQKGGAANLGTSADLGLLVSNDGLHFREPVKGHVFLSRFDAAATPYPGGNFNTILVQSGNGIINVGDETRIYHGRWLHADVGQGYSGEIGLATLPRDRWGALGLYPESFPTHRSHGSVWSAPVRLPAGGGQVVLNADHAARLSVEISDADFELLPGFSGGNAGKTRAAGGLDCVVAWPRTGLAALGGQTVRFKINFAKQGAADPRLYAVYLRAGGE